MPRRKKRQSTIDMGFFTPSSMSMPASSSQMSASNPNKRRKLATQSTINFANHTGFSLSDHVQEPVNSKSTPSSRTEDADAMFRGTSLTGHGHRRRRRRDSSSSSEEEAVVQRSSQRTARSATRRQPRLPDPTSTAAPKQTSTPTSSISSTLTLDTTGHSRQASQLSSSIGCALPKDSTSVPSMTPQRTGNSRAKKQTVISDDSDDDVGHNNASVTRTPGSTCNGKQNKTDIGEPESSGDDLFVALRANRSKASTTNTSKVSTTNRVDLATPKKSRAKQRSRNSNRNGDDSFIVDDDEVDEEDEDKDSGPITPSSKRKHRATRTEASLSASDDVSPTKKRRVLRGKASRRRQAQMDAEIKEDLEDLGLDDADVTQDLPRSSIGKITASRNAALDLFKRARRDKDATLAFTSSQNVSEEDDDDDANDDDADINGKTGEYDLDMHNGENEVDFDNDDDFVVDDEDGAIGVPTVELPANFSRLSIAKPRKVFPNVVEWMVLNIVYPGFETKQYHRISIDRVNTELGTLATSKFKSSIWKADFNLSLTYRPEIILTHIQGEGMAGCEACGRRNHHASYEVTFRGSPYNYSTLHDLEVREEDQIDGRGGVEDNDDDDNNANASGEDEDAGEDEEDEERGDGDDDATATTNPTSPSSTASSASDPLIEPVVYDPTGNPIPPSTRVYACGKTCARNADYAHKLLHWRHELRRWVRAWLDVNGHLTAEKVVARSGKKEGRRMREGVRIARAMEEGGEVARLWDRFEEELERARSAPGSGAGRGWGRDE